MTLSGHPGWPRKDSRLTTPVFSRLRMFPELKHLARDVSLEPLHDTICNLETPTRDARTDSQFDRSSPPSRVNPRRSHRHNLGSAESQWQAGTGDTRNPLHRSVAQVRKQHWTGQRERVQARARHRHSR
eukprot:870975-Pyramimonas_sp.AAC.1